MPYLNRRGQDSNPGLWSGKYFAKPLESFKKYQTSSRSYQPCICYVINSSSPNKRPIQISALEATFKAIMGYETPVVQPPSDYKGEFFKGKRFISLGYSWSCLSSYKFQSWLYSFELFRCHPKNGCGIVSIDLEVVGSSWTIVTYSWESGIRNVKLAALIEHWKEVELDLCYLLPSSLLSLLTIK